MCCAVGSCILRGNEAIQLVVIEALVAGAVTEVGDRITPS